MARCRKGGNFIHLAFRCKPIKLYLWQEYHCSASSAHHSFPDPGQVLTAAQSWIGSQERVHPELVALGYTAVPDFRNRTLWGDTSPRTVKAAGLPNITGAFNAQQNKSNNWALQAKGAFVHNTPYSGVINSGEGAAGYGYSFDASKSNFIYGNSTTVQPPALTVRFLIRAKS